MDAAAQVSKDRLHIHWEESNVRFGGSMPNLMGMSGRTGSYQIVCVPAKSNLVSGRGWQTAQRAGGK